MRFVGRRRPAPLPAAQRHARPARPLRRDRHDRPAARQGRGGDHRQRRAQPRRRADRRAGGRRPRPQVTYYGVAGALRELFPNDEELYGGPVHLSALPARGRTAGAALAGRTRPPPLRIDGTDHDVVLRAEGPHNAQNACGAAALGLALGLDEATVVAGLAKVQPAFGRGQSFTVDGRRVVLQLVKNPGGFRQSLRTLDTSDPDAVVIVINDDYADGRDVSWLWDVDFAPVARLTARRSTSGTRAADMAVRLRYDDVEVDEIETDLEKAVRSAVAAGARRRRGDRVQHLHRDVGVARDPAAHRTGGLMTPLTLVHLYPREMNIYGDTGNVVVLRKRLQWRSLPVEVVPVSIGDPLPSDADIVLGGGGQDAAQGDIGADFAARGAELRAMADDGVVMLTICGSYQMLGPRVRDPGGPPDRRRRGPGRRHPRPARPAHRQQLGRHPRHRAPRRLREPQRPDDARPGRPPARHAPRTAAATTARTAPRAPCATTSSAPTCTGRCWPRARRFADDLLRRAYARRGDDRRAGPARRRAAAARGPGGGRTAPVRARRGARPGCWPSVAAAGLGRVQRRLRRRGRHARPCARRPCRLTRTAHAGADLHAGPGRPTSVALPPGRRDAAGRDRAGLPVHQGRTGQRADGAPNVADIEGDRIDRRPCSPADKPVGCRFYFPTPRAPARGRRRHPAVHARHGARRRTTRMVRTAEVSAPKPRPRRTSARPGRHPLPHPFFGPDGAQDWAFAFAKGRHAGRRAHPTDRTPRSTPSSLGAAIMPRSSDRGRQSRVAG